MPLVLNVFWNRDEERIRALWRILAQIILLILFVIVAHSLLGGLTAYPAIQGLNQLVILGGSSLLAARWFDRRRLTNLGLRVNREWWIDFGFGLALGIVLMSSIFVVQYACGWIAITAGATEGGTWSIVFALLGALVLYLGVGFGEEVWTRGYLLTNLAEGMKMGYVTARSSTVASVVVTSALFGMLHAGNPGATPTSTLNIMLAGLMLGLPYILTGQLAIPIGLHISWNFVQGPVFGFPVSGYAGQTARIVSVEQSGPTWWTGGTFGPEAGGIGLIAMALGIGAILAWVAWRNGTLRLDRTVAAPPILAERV